MLAIVLVIALQALWFILPRHGSAMGEPYRNSSRIAAPKEHAERPSAATRQAMERAFIALGTHGPPPGNHSPHLFDRRCRANLVLLELLESQASE